MLPLRGKTDTELWTRLRFLQRGGVPVPLTRSRVPPGGCQGGTTSDSEEFPYVEGSSCHRHFATCEAAEGIGWPLS